MLVTIDSSQYPASKGREKRKVEKSKSDFPPLQIPQTARDLHFNAANKATGGFIEPDICTC
jgi:hypothetical protein